MRFYRLQDRCDLGPYAVMAVGDDGRPRRFVPGEGLVDWPVYSDYLQGEVGAYPITEAEARALMSQGVGGQLEPWAVEHYRGKAPTIPV